MTDMILDVALSEKNMYEEGVELTDQFDNMKDIMRYCAYGGKGIGMPKGGLGLPLTNDNFLKFQQNITPSNTLFSLAGHIDNQKVMNLIKEKIKAKYPKCNKIII